jgi:hypothetical protein
LVSLLSHPPCPELLFYDAAMVRETPKELMKANMALLSIYNISSLHTGTAELDI